MDKVILILVMSLRKRLFHSQDLFVRSFGTAYSSLFHSHTAVGNFLDVRILIVLYLH